MQKMLSIGNTLAIKKKQAYQQMDDENGLLRHKSGGSASFSSRYFSDDDVSASLPILNCVEGKDMLIQFES